MRRDELIMWIVVRGCVTADDVAKTIGISRYNGWARLHRLKRRGVLKVVWVRRKAWWCVPGARPPVFRRVVPGSRRRRKTTDLLRKVEELLEGGCVATSALMRALGFSHTQAFYAFRLLQAEGRAVKTKLGRVAIWCRDRETAVRFLEELRGEVVRLVKQHRARYVTPKRLLGFIASDARARKLFSRFIDVRSPSATAYGALATLLEMVYGDPVAKSIYHTAQQRQKGIEIRVVDSVEKEKVVVNLTPDLAVALGDVDSETVLQAIEQLLQRYRS